MRDKYLNEYFSELTYQKLIETGWRFNEKKLQRDYRLWEKKNTKKDIPKGSTLNKFIRSLPRKKLNQYGTCASSPCASSTCASSINNSLLKILLTIHFGAKYNDKLNAIIKAQKLLTHLHKDVTALAKKRGLSKHISLCLDFKTIRSSYLTITNKKTSQIIKYRISDHRELCDRFEKPNYNISLQNFTHVNLDIGVFCHITKEERRQRQRQPVHNTQVNFNYADFTNNYPDTATEILFAINLPTK